MKKILKKENRTTLIVSIICFVLISVVATYTYSFFAVTKNNSAIIAGEAESLGLTVVVDQLAPDPSADLIPQMDEYITSAIIGRNGSCVDDNGNTVCHTYKITVTNANVATKVSGTLTLDNKQNPNLRWAVYNYVHDDETGNIVPALVGAVKMPEDVILVANEDFAAGETKEYYIVVWIRETGMIQMDKGEYSGVVNFFTGNDVSGGIDTSGANAPALTENLIPVKYNEVLNSWVKADSSNFNSNWYNYDDKRWANAVLVKDSWYYPVVEEKNKTVNISNEDITKYSSGWVEYEGCDQISSMEYKFTTGASGGELSFNYEIFDTSYDGEQPQVLTILLNEEQIIDDPGEYEYAILCIESYGGECDYSINARYSVKKYSKTLLPNTAYSLVAHHSRSCEADINIPASIYNIKIPNDAVFNEFYPSFNGDLPWLLETTKEIQVYDSYEILDNGNYKLNKIYYAVNEETTDYEYENIMTLNNKYICSDGASTECDKIYQIKGYNDNAITRVDSYTTQNTTRNELLSSESGTPIDLSGILAQYVWIPRYKYRVWNINKEMGVDAYNAISSGIDIVFEEGISTTGDVVCTYDFSKTAENAVRSEECTGINGESYYTHPAFTFGEDELTGIWIGKYELSSKHGALIKPGLRTKEQIFSNVGEVHNLAKSMQETNNIYGLSIDLTEVDSHVITNMEWGVMAYFTQSKYGTCGTNGCLGVEYNTTNNEGTVVLTGAGGSTTDNYYGIYDTVGGSLEFVMGSASLVEGVYEFAGGDSGFLYNNNTSKYLTTYAYGLIEDQEFIRSRLGDAVAEVGGWDSIPGYSWDFDEFSMWMRNGAYGLWVEDSENGRDNLFFTQPTGDGLFNSDSSRFVLSVFSD